MGWSRMSINTNKTITKHTFKSTYRYSIIKLILHPILQGIDLLSVAIHEIGHVIGLPPSNISGSVMYPIFDQQRHELYERDHEAVKKLFENIKSNGK